MSLTGGSARSRQASLQDISPYYIPSSSPPVLPTLLAQTEIGKTFLPTKLLAQEEIGLRPQLVPTSVPVAQFKRRGTTHVRFSHYSSSRERSEDVEPYPIPAPGPSQPSQPPRGNLIPKPAGEAARPNRGGYTLAKELGLNKQDMSKLKEVVKAIVKEHLDPNLCFQSQPSVEAIKVAEKLVAERYPVIQKYENLWPATDLIRLRLKYTSAAHRSKQGVADKKAGKSLRLASRTTST